MTKRRWHSLLKILLLLALWGVALSLLVWKTHLVGTVVGEEVRLARDELGETLLGLKVRIALLEKLGLEAMAIRIDAEGDRITLRGGVPSASIAQRAREIASSVEGVAKVTSDLRTEAAGGGPGIKEKAAQTAGAVKRELADALLEARVKTRLLSEVGASALRIEVEARRGMVSLTGRVKNGQVKTLALAAATDTAGVKGVADLLTAESELSP
jgi:osmotically-inducible protein OsmY